MLLLGALAAGCSSGSAPTTYDLSAPTSRIGGSAGRADLRKRAGGPPVLSTQQILVKDQSGAISFLGAGQWADNLPRLIQTRLINTFENASQLRGVSRPSSGAVADVQLISELRSFEISTPDQRGLCGDVGQDRERGERADRQCAHFPGSRPDASVDAANAARALDQALSVVMLDIVRWVSGSRLPRREASEPSPS